MADVYAVTFTVIGIVLSTPALLVALNLLLPSTTTHAYRRLKRTPGKSFLLGLPVLLAFTIWTAVMAQFNFGPARALAFVGAFFGMAIGAVGGAASARLIGERLSDLSDPVSDLKNLIRGAIVYEMACLTPIVGWFVFAPLIGVTALGAATFGLLRWSPGPAGEDGGALFDTLDMQTDREGTTHRPSVLIVD